VFIEEPFFLAYLDLINSFLNESPSTYIISLLNNLSILYDNLPSRFSLFLNPSFVIAYRSSRDSTSGKAYMNYRGY
jgi:hypothetical protein